MARAKLPQRMSLYTSAGRRKYLTPTERCRFIATAAGEPPEIETFCLTLAWTGCRVSEGLGLTHADIDHDEKMISVRCLKKRKADVIREVPVPTALLKAILRVHGNGPPDARLWTMVRSTAWRQVKIVMLEAGVGATAACPKGLRHGFGVHALRSGIPLNLLQRWLGHRDIATTAIYADAMGAEEREIASRMWDPETA